MQNSFLILFCDMSIGSSNSGRHGAFALFIDYRQTMCADTNDAVDGTAADTEALGGAKTKAAVDALLAQLPKCISRDLCDDLSVNFCYLNSKAARKRLVRVLCETHRSNLQLLPFYARIAAILSQVFSDVGAAVVKAQEDEFNFLQVCSAFVTVECF